MTACARCHAEAAPTELFFSQSGDQICRRCHASEQTAVADARARESLEQGTPEGLRATSGGSPTGSIVAGAALIGLSVLWLGAGLLVVGKLYFYPIFLFGAGFVALARGLKARS